MVRGEIRRGGRVSGAVVAALWLALGTALPAQEAFWVDIEALIQRETGLSDAEIEKVGVTETGNMRIGVTVGIEFSTVGYALELSPDGQQVLLLREIQATGARPDTRADMTDDHGNFLGISDSGRPGQMVWGEFDQRTLFHTDGDNSNSISGRVTDIELAGASTFLYVGGLVGGLYLPELGVQDLPFLLDPGLGGGGPVFTVTVTKSGTVAAGATSTPVSGVGFLGAVWTNIPKQLTALPDSGQTNDFVFTTPNGFDLYGRVGPSLGAGFAAKWSGARTDSMPTIILREDGSSQPGAVSDATEEGWLVGGDGFHFGPIASANGGFIVDPADGFARPLSVVLLEKGLVGIGDVSEGRGITRMHNRLYIAGDRIPGIYSGGAAIFVFAPEVTEVNLPFLRGDSNRDGDVDIADASRILDALFTGSATLPCDDAADANDDGAVDLSDAVAILEFLFLGARIIDAPGTIVVGEDPTEDALDCAE